MRMCWQLFVKFTPCASCMMLITVVTVECDKKLSSKTRSLTWISHIKLMLLDHVLFCKSLCKAVAVFTMHNKKKWISIILLLYQRLECFCIKPFTLNPVDHGELKPRTFSFWADLSHWDLNTRGGFVCPWLFPNKREQGNFLGGFC